MLPSIGYYHTLEKLLIVSTNIYFSNFSIHLDLNTWSEVMNIITTQQLLTCLVKLAQIVTQLEIAAVQASLLHNLA